MGNNDEHRSKATMHRRFLEFFAGGGMIRAGLEAGWSCLWANDVAAKKAEPAGVPWHTQAETQKEPKCASITGPDASVRQAEGQVVKSCCSLRRTAFVRDCYRRGRLRG